PATAFQFAQWKRAKPNIDYHVEFDGHYYSVPYALAGQAVELRSKRPPPPRPLTLAQARSF
ncbi:hypothetical protein GPA23_20335, partial [Aromatoleum aromaticum]